MRKRCNNDYVPEEDPPKKKNCDNSAMSSLVLKQGEFLKDVAGKQWKLGKAVGVGGFGEIFLASDNLTKEVRSDSKYVAKVENHKSGPLFVEMNCYLRIAKPDMIDEWKREKKMCSLGMPNYVASGSHIHKDEKYRFLILPKFDRDLEKILQEKKMLNLKTVLTISSQIVDVLEYIHHKGYVHSDIKASNILLTQGEVVKQLSVPKMSLKYPVLNPTRACRKQKFINRRIMRNLRQVTHVSYNEDNPYFDILLELDGFQDLEKYEFQSRDQAYLLDYGLACKYLSSDGQHKPFCADERKAHAGTIMFCSRDAHKGAPSRRSDLESLGYNIVSWLTGNLPWSKDADNPEIVARKKMKAMANIEYFLSCCFMQYPKFLEEYFKYVQNLQFQEKPDYEYCKNLFKKTLTANGYKDDSLFDFDNLSTQKLKTTKKRPSENLKIRKVIHQISRPPLQSNIPVKPLLRKKIKNKKRKNKNNWFEELTDPEEILKQAREKRNSENQDSNFLADLDIERLNPTYAMIEVYNKSRDRIEALPTCKGDSYSENVDGYTPAMMSVLQKIKRRKELDCEQAAHFRTGTRSGKVKSSVSHRKKKHESPVIKLVKLNKSAIVLKKPALQARKNKSSASRSYSLRG